MRATRPSCCSTISPASPRMSASTCRPITRRGSTCSRARCRRRSALPCATTPACGCSSVLAAPRRSRPRRSAAAMPPSSTAITARSRWSTTPSWRAPASSTASSSGTTTARSPRSSHCSICWRCPARRLSACTIPGSPTRRSTMPSLEITTMVGCPLMCSYCPQDALKAAYGKGVRYLSFSDFKTILAKVPKHVRIDFSGMAEPWANSQATAMLRHTLESGYSVAIYTTLYGMTVEDADAVIGLLRERKDQVETLCLHLPDRFGNMTGFKPSARYEEVLRAFLAFGAENVLGEDCFRTMTMDRDGGVHDSLAKLIQWIPGGAWIGNTRAGNVDARTIEAPSVEGHVKHLSPVSCSYTPFYDQNVLLPNGDVVLCCMDYSERHRLGNLLTDDYWSLFTSVAMTSLRLENQKADGCSLCKTCSRATVWQLNENTHQVWDAIPP